VSPQINTPSVTKIAIPMARATLSNAVIANP
jgi:hypothetical protein